MARPAGYSSEEFDEDDDDDEFSMGFSFRRSRVPRVVPDRTEALLVDAIVDRDLDAMKQAMLREGMDIEHHVSIAGGWTALMHACHVGYKEGIEYLLEQGADVKNHYEMTTPLLCVCDSTHTNEQELLECLNLLLAKGADPHAGNWFNVTPLMYAVRKKHQLLVLALINQKCDINASDADGWTPLFYAVENGDLSMVQLLIDYGGKIDVRDTRGRTLEELAIVKLYKEIAEVVKVRKKCLKMGSAVLFSDTTKDSELTQYQSLIKQCPKTDDPLYGFSSDAVKLIRGIGLNQLVGLFVEKNIQLGEMIMWSDEELRRAGVSLSFHRLKIRHCCKMLIEHPWGKNSLRKPDIEANLSIFEITQILANLVRQIHLISLTTMYCNKYRTPVGESVDRLKFINASLESLSHAKTHINAIKSIIDAINKEHNVVPTDLILPKQPKRLSLKKVIIVSCVIGVSCYKLNVGKHFLHALSYLPFFTHVSTKSL